MGLEIGGPSRTFSQRGLFPIYGLAESIDNCNFSCQTLWEGTISPGNSFVYDKRKPAGNQFVREATDLHGLADESYDFMLSSHTLEHSANPIRALYEWIRVLKKEGTLVLILPHLAETFDHRRPVTTLEHMIEDHASSVGEDDLTHLPEILALHDLSRDPKAGDHEAFRARSQRNLENRALHQHVFDLESVAALLAHVGLALKSIERCAGMHIVALAVKAS